MGFFSFLGRVLFASIFILSAWKMFNEFGDDGGPATKELVPKFVAANKHLSSVFGGVEILKFDAKYFVAADIVLKGFGGLLFIFNSMIGAALMLLHLLVTSPILFDFFNYSQDEAEYSILLNEFLQRVALCGALLFFMQMKTLLVKRQPKKKAPKAKVT